MQRLQADLARMSPEQVVACWQMGRTLAALSLARQEGRAALAGVAWRMNGKSGTRSQPAALLSARHG